MVKNNFPDVCGCCRDYVLPEKQKIVYQWELCSVIIPKKPSVDRKDGGHLILFPHRHITKRSDLLPNEAIALMRSSMIVEQALYDVLLSLGIDLVNVNIGDYGNRKADEPFEKRHLHLHFYGRVRDDKNFSHKEYLCLPPKGSKYYDSIVPFSEKDRKLLRKRIEELDNERRFDFGKN